MNSNEVQNQITGCIKQIARETLLGSTGEKRVIHTRKLGGEI